MKSIIMALSLFIFSTTALAENYKTKLGASGSVSIVQLTELNELANKIAYYDLENTDLDLSSRELEFTSRAKSVLQTNAGQAAMFELVQAAANFLRTGGVMSLPDVEQNSTPEGFVVFESIHDLNPLLIVALRGAALMTMNNMIRHFDDARNTKWALAICATVIFCAFGARIHGQAASSRSWDCGNCNPAILNNAMKCAEKLLDPTYTGPTTCGYFQTDDMVQDVKSILAAEKIIIVLSEIAIQRKMPFLSGLSINPENQQLVDSTGSEKILKGIDDAIGTSYIWQKTKAINQTGLKK